MAPIGFRQSSDSAWDDYSPTAKQVIVCNIDGVLATLLTRSVIAAKTKDIDIVHNLRKKLGPHASDLELLLASTKNVVSTDWSVERTLKVMEQYTASRGWPTGSVGVYLIGMKVYP
jgi:hypothetical protein